VITDVQKIFDDKKAPDIDGLGFKGIDFLRIVIWDNNDNNRVIFDNERGELLDDLPTFALNAKSDDDDDDDDDKVLKGKIHVHDPKDKDDDDDDD